MNWIFYEGGDVGVKIMERERERGREEEVKEARLF